MAIKTNGNLYKIKKYDKYDFIELFSDASNLTHVSGFSSSLNEIAFFTVSQKLYKFDPKASHFVTSYLINHSLNPIWLASGRFTLPYIITESGLVYKSTCSALKDYFDTKNICVSTQRHALLILPQTQLIRDVRLISLYLRGLG